jgi:hypothetical protein
VEGLAILGVDDNALPLMPSAHAIFDYIETFYNRTGLHSSLDYKSPINFEKSEQARTRERKTAHLLVRPLYS